MNSNYYDDPSKMMDEEEKLLLAKLLRGQTQPHGQLQGGYLVGGPGVYSTLKGHTDEWKTQSRLREIKAQRAAEESALQSGLTDLANKGEGATAADFMKYGPTRATGVKILEGQQERSRKKRALQDTLGALGVGGGDGVGGAPVSPANLKAKAMAMVMSGDKDMADQGKAILAEMKLTNPQQNFEPDPFGGPGRQLPAALDAYAQNQLADERARAEYRINDRPIGGGRTQAMTDAEYMRRMGTPVPGPQRAQAGPVGVGVGAAPGTGVGAAPARPATVSGAAPVGGGVPPGGPVNDELKIWGGPEGVAKAFATATQRGDLRTAGYFADLASRHGIGLTASNQLTEPQRRAMGATADDLSQVMRQTPAPQGAPVQPQYGFQQMPHQSGQPGQPQQLPQPAGQPPQYQPLSSPFPQNEFGVSDPGAAKMRELGMTSGRKVLDTGRAELDKQVSALKTVQQMSELNQKGEIISGPFANQKLLAKRAWAQTFGGPDPSVSDTEFYEKLNLSQLRDSLKAYGSGTGISNLDLLTAMKTLPGISNTPQGRQLIIDYMQGTLISNIKNQQAAEAYFARNRTLDGFEPQNYDKNGAPVPMEQMYARMEEAKKQGEWTKRVAGERKKLDEEQPLYFDTLKDVGRHIFNTTRGSPKNMEAGAEAAMYAGMAIPAGRAAGIAGKAALPGIKKLLSSRALQFGAGSSIPWMIYQSMKEKQG